MKNLLAAIAGLFLSGCGVYTVVTGNVAVERTLGSVVVIPANIQGFDLILDTNTLGTAAVRQ